MSPLIEQGSHNPEQTAWIKTFKDKLPGIGLGGLAIFLSALGIDRVAITCLLNTLATTNPLQVLSRQGFIRHDSEQPITQIPEPLPPLEV